MRGLLLLISTLAVLAVTSRSQITRTVGRLQEVFAWKQITFNINGNDITQDRYGDDDLDMTRDKRQAGSVFFNNDDDDAVRNWNQTSQNKRNNRPNNRPRPMWGPTTSSTTTPTPSDEAGRFFIQYNNLPMGVERVDNRLFITLPRRRYGIPSTLNYLDLTRDSNTRSPGLRPYPNLRDSRALTSVYRTRADSCNRLWMVDTGLLEIPNDRQQVRQPAVVVYDLRTDRQILRYELKSTDIIAANTPTGLASITLDIVDDCANTFAYIPDLATYGLIVYSLRDNDSWRLTHNYFSFNPIAGNLRLAGQRFQWSDGIFSVTLTEPRGGCSSAYFHAMVGTHEFSVSSCVLRNRTASQDPNFWSQFSEVGDRGANSQSTMHGYHAGTRVVFFADIGRDAISCWNTAAALTPAAVEILAKDSTRLSYPSDLHVTGDEVWVMANSLPTWAYSRLDTNEYNFFIYKANVQDLISGTVCAGRGRVRVNTRTGTDKEENNNTTTT
ncbi:L-dopachrome tautomerase yellow-f2-like isoform X2 [Pectinophora gossypiella]|uniref:L-dopachrome tautomerase yellow-f2-like isoform X2 n=1 Tax=Pectinophora gossypiella TaxID=13191 RepID=UPI00214EBEC9|nr:L-dopachrome tautomerase yellow-f2-like isoform X2 [Pectinophora gossypiella]